MSTPTAVSLHESLDRLAAQRAEFTDLPAMKMAAILHQLSPEDAARVTAIAKEFDEREAILKQELERLEASIKEMVLLTGASAQGTYLLATINAPRVTWDAKALDGYSLAHPEIREYRTVGEPWVRIGARAIRKS